MPCDPDAKKPRVSFGHIKRPLTRCTVEVWATRFGDAGIGLLTGPPSGLTIVDVDAKGGNPDRLLRESLNRFGDTPLIATTPSGGYHAAYRHNSERNVVGLDGRPIDIRGRGGFVVAPPSNRRDGRAYGLLRGRLDRETVSSLPAIRRDALDPPQSSTGKVKIGQRHDMLFRFLLRHAPYCDDFDALLDVAQSFNLDSCDPPESDAKVVNTAKSVWKLQLEGRNWCGRPRLDVPTSAYDCLEANDDALRLYLHLRRHWRDGERFPVSAKAMAATGSIQGWGNSPRRYRAALAYNLGAGTLVQAYKGGAGPGDPSQFTFSSPRKGSCGEP